MALECRVLISMNGYPGTASWRERGDDRCAADLWRCPVMNAGRIRRLCSDFHSIVAMLFIPCDLMAYDVPSKS